MTSQTRLTTIRDETIVIEFLDNEFVNEFVAHLHDIHQSFHYRSWQKIIPYPRQQWNQATVDENRQKIISSIHSLNQLGLTFPIDADAVDFVQHQPKQDRELLNRLHRCFTTGHATRNTWEYNTQHTFVLADGDYPIFSRLVHDINDAVHAIECYYSNDRIQSFPQYTEYQIEYLSHDTRHNPVVTHQQFFQPIQEQHKKYFTRDQSYTVWLPLYQIQGKNYWVGYFDYDDPRHWDISTNVVYSGSFSLGSRRILHQPQLVAWLESYGIDPGPEQGGMPLGHVTQGWHLVQLLQPGDIKDIVIDA
jgi:hypothetical protein